MISFFLKPTICILITNTLLPSDLVCAPLYTTDNEWGYSNRLVDLALYCSKK